MNRFRDGYDVLSAPRVLQKTLGAHVRSLCADSPWKDASTLSCALNGMEGHSLITRCRSPANRRMVSVELLKHVEAAAYQAVKLYQGLWESLTDNVADTDLRALTQVLQAMSHGD